jgi:hypothetical protein
LSFCGKIEKDSIVVFLLLEQKKSLSKAASEKTLPTMHLDGNYNSNYTDLSWNWNIPNGIGSDATYGMPRRNFKVLFWSPCDQSEKR